MTQNTQIINYAKYNIWANNAFIKSLSQVKEEILHQQIEASFPSLMQTISHIWLAEMGWLSRLEGKGWETSIVDNFSGKASEMFNAWRVTSTNFRDFLEKTDLEQKLSFQHNGEAFSIPFHQIAHTVFNHGSYHRGQLVIMMRQLGLINIPKTDYIAWVREKQS